MRNMKVLLVDDEEEFVTTLAERLELRGMEAHAVTDGEAALAAIESDCPQIVVLDIMMPGIDGLEVLKRIKTQIPDLPVILLTGRGSTKEGIKGMQLGAVDYLMKPINIDELIKKMHTVIKEADPSY